MRAFSLYAQRRRAFNLLTNQMTSVQIKMLQIQARRAARKEAEATRDMIYLRKQGGVAIV